MSPRPDVSEERRNQILDAAIQVFGRLGFSKARMDDIVAESRLSKGALYWYFESKDAVVQAILGRVFDQEFAAFRALLDAEGSVSERLITYSARMGAQIERFMSISGLVYEFYGMAGRHQVVRSFLREYFQHYRVLIVRLIAQGVERGEFRPDLDPDTAAVTLSAFYEGLFLLFSIDPENTDWGSYAERGLRMLLEGLRAPGPPTPDTQA